MARKKEFKKKNYDKKKILKIIEIIFLFLVLFLMIYVTLKYLNREGYFEKYFFAAKSLVGYGGYGGYGDPCDVDPGEPDPCGGS